LDLRVPLVLDVCEDTFRLLDQLLAAAAAGLAGSDWPPTQDKECLTVACLNLLHLQVSDVNLRQDKSDFLSYDTDKLRMFRRLSQIYKQDVKKKDRTVFKNLKSMKN